MTQCDLDDEALLRQLRAAREQAAAGAEPVLDALMRLCGLGAAELDEVLRRTTGVAAIATPAPLEPLPEALPVALARTLGVAAVRRPPRDEVLMCMADPWDDGKVQALADALGRWPVLAAASAALLAHLQPPQPSAGARAEVAAHAGSVVDFVDRAIEQALEAGASDIHFESDRAGVSVRLRQDGVMVDLSRLEGTQRAEEVVSRVKVLAQLDITERRTPQDGRFRWQQGSQALDLRVSIMPSIHGEDAVLRLLDRAQLRSPSEAASLRTLGFVERQAQRLQALARLPHGMLLITGPTGSGKTTTVYAALSEINTGLEKIITIEDPVEYELPGVLQIPVNERKGLTFAKGLRSILRHDPDRILVGEIRDAETAEIAVQSALTGHQVFTTVHANSIYDVMGRFRHFGLDMFGFMSSLNGVAVQRLLRRLCPQCARHRPPTAQDLRWFEPLDLRPETLPLAWGCGHCKHTGYRGRSVVAEVHVVDDALRDLVTSQAPVTALRRHVEQGDVPTLALQGARMVAEGLTTLEEVQRVVGWVALPGVQGEGA